ncbi:MAG: tetratricopeptide repeat protein, partial [Phenylobacterium sp.]
PATGSALGAALASGQLRRPGPAADVRRALALAQQAEARDGDDPEVLRALGLALSASGQVTEAARAYDRALTTGPENWGVLVNRADLHDLAGQPERALPLLERAYDNMDLAYRSAPARIRPWQARLGVEIARRHQAIGDIVQAEQWYRRTATDDPSSRDALDGLARLGAPQGSAQARPNGS